MKHVIKWYQVTNMTGHYVFPDEVSIKEFLFNSELDVNLYEDGFPYKLTSHTFIFDPNQGWALSMIFIKD